MDNASTEALQSTGKGKSVPSSTSVHLTITSESTRSNDGGFPFCSPFVASQSYGCAGTVRIGVARMRVQQNLRSKLSLLVGERDWIEGLRRSKPNRRKQSYFRHAEESIRPSPT